MRRNLVYVAKLKSPLFTNEISWIRGCFGEKGFTLVELMVVVTIIGILSAVAVPNVTRHIAKARRAEVKTNLSALYSAEQTFHAEFNTYTNAFQAMGFRPVGALRYSIGFGGSPVNTAANLGLYGYIGTPPLNATTGRSGVPGYCAGSDSAAVITASVNGCGMMNSALLENGFINPSPTAVGPATTFTAGGTGIVIGQVISAIVPNADMWTINQDKTLVNIGDGVNF